MDTVLSDDKKRFVVLAYYLGRRKILDCIAICSLTMAILDALKNCDSHANSGCTEIITGCCLCKEKHNIFKNFWLHCKRSLQEGDCMKNGDERDAEDAWNDVLKLWSNVKKIGDGKAQPKLVLLLFEKACKDVMQKHGITKLTGCRTQHSEFGDYESWLSLINAIKNELHSCINELRKISGSAAVKDPDSSTLQEQKLRIAGVILHLQKDVNDAVDCIQRCRTYGVDAEQATEEGSISVEYMLCGECFIWENVSHPPTILQLLEECYDFCKEASESVTETKMSEEHRKSPEKLVHITGHRERLVLKKTELSPDYKPDREPQPNAEVVTTCARDHKKYCTRKSNRVAITSEKLDKFICYDTDDSLSHKNAKAVEIGRKPKSVVQLDEISTILSSSKKQFLSGKAIDNKLNASNSAGQTCALNAPRRSRIRRRRKCEKKNKKRLYDWGLQDVPINAILAEEEGKAGNARSLPEVVSGFVKKFPSTTSEHESLRSSEQNCLVPKPFEPHFLCITTTIEQQGWRAYWYHRCRCSRVIKSFNEIRDRGKKHVMLLPRFPVHCGAQSVEKLERSHLSLVSNQELASASLDPDLLGVRCARLNRNERKHTGDVKHANDVMKCQLTRKCSVILKRSRIAPQTRVGESDVSYPSHSSPHLVRTHYIKESRRHGMDDMLRSRHSTVQTVSSTKPKVAVDHSQNFISPSRNSSTEQLKACIVNASKSCDDLHKVMMKTKQPQLDGKSLGGACKRYLSDKETIAGRCEALDMENVTTNTASVKERKQSGSAGCSISGNPPATSQVITSVKRLLSKRLKDSEALGPESFESCSLLQKNTLKQSDLRCTSISKTSHDNHTGVKNHCMLLPRYSGWGFKTNAVSAPLKNSRGIADQKSAVIRVHSDSNCVKMNSIGKKAKASKTVKSCKSIAKGGVLAYAMGTITSRIPSCDTECSTIPSIVMKRVRLVRDSIEKHRKSQNRMVHGIPAPSLCRVGKQKEGMQKMEQKKKYGAVPPPLYAPQSRKRDLGILLHCENVPTTLKAKIRKDHKGNWAVLRASENSPNQCCTSRKISALSHSEPPKAHGMNPVDAGLLHTPPGRSGSSRSYASHTKSVFGGGFSQDLPDSLACSNQTELLSPQMFISRSEPSGRDFNFSSVLPHPVCFSRCPDMSSATFLDHSSLPIENCRGLTSKGEVVDSVISRSITSQCMCLENNSPPSTRADKNSSSCQYEIQKFSLTKSIVNDIAAIGYASEQKKPAVIAEKGKENEPHERCHENGTPYSLESKCTSVEQRKSLYDFKRKQHSTDFSFVRKFRCDSWGKYDRCEKDQEEEKQAIPQFLEIYSELKKGAKLLASKRFRTDMTLANGQSDVIEMVKRELRGRLNLRSHKLFKLLRSRSMKTYRKSKKWRTLSEARHRLTDNMNGCLFRIQGLSGPDFQNDLLSKKRVEVSSEQGRFLPIVNKSVASSEERWSSSEENCSDVDICDASGDCTMNAESDLLPNDISRNDCIEHLSGAKIDSEMVVSDDLQRSTQVHGGMNASQNTRNLESSSMGEDRTLQNTRNVGSSSMEEDCTVVDVCDSTDKCNENLNSAPDVNGENYASAVGLSEFCKQAHHYSEDSVVSVLNVKESCEENCSYVDICNSAEECLEHLKSPIMVNNEDERLLTNLPPKAHGNQAFAPCEVPVSDIDKASHLPQLQSDTTLSSCIAVGGSTGEWAEPFSTAKDLHEHMPIDLSRNENAKRVFVASRDEKCPVFEWHKASLLPCLQSKDMLLLNSEAKGYSNELEDSLDVNLRDGTDRCIETLKTSSSVGAENQSLSTCSDAATYRSVDEYAENVETSVAVHSESEHPFIPTSNSDVVSDRLAGNLKVPDSTNAGNQGSCFDVAKNKCWKQLQESPENSETPLRDMKASFPSLRSCYKTDLLAKTDIQRCWSNGEDYPDAVVCGNTRKCVENLWTSDDETSENKQSWVESSENGCNIGVKCTEHPKTTMNVEEVDVCARVDSKCQEMVNGGKEYPHADLTRTICSNPLYKACKDSEALVCDDDKVAHTLSLHEDVDSSSTGSIDVMAASQFQNVASGGRTLRQNISCHYTDSPSTRISQTSVMSGSSCQDNAGKYCHKDAASFIKESLRRQMGTIPGALDGMYWSSAIVNAQASTSTQRCVLRRHCITKLSSKTIKQKRGNKRKRSGIGHNLSATNYIQSVLNADEDLMVNKRRRDNLMSDPEEDSDNDDGDPVEYLFKSSLNLFRVRAMMLDSTRAKSFQLQKTQAVCNNEKTMFKPIHSIHESTEGISTSNPELLEPKVSEDLETATTQQSQKIPSSKPETDGEDTQGRYKDICSRYSPQLFQAYIPLTRCKLPR